MRLTKERKLCAGVLSLAAAALVVDRVFLGAAGPEEAFAVTLDSSGGPGPEPATKKDAGPAAVLVPVAKQLAMVTLLAAVETDGFAAPAAWAAALERMQVPSGAPVETPAAVAVNDRAAGWRAGKRFTGTLNVRDPSRAAALIDGRLIKLDQELDGLRLVEVTVTSAKFVDPSGEVVVEFGTAAGEVARGGEGPAAASPDGRAEKK